MSLTGAHHDPEAWEGDGAAAALGALLARVDLEEPTQDRLIVGVMSHAASPKERLASIMALGAAVWLSRPGPAGAAAPGRRAGSSGKPGAGRGEPELRPGLRTLCAWMYPTMGGIAGLALAWLEAAAVQGGSPAGARRRHAFQDAACAVLAPMWKESEHALRWWGRAQVPVSGIAETMLECAGMLMDAPEYADRVWREWLG